MGSSLVVHPNMSSKRAETGSRNYYRMAAVCCRGYMRIEDLLTIASLTSGRLPPASRPPRRP